MLPSQVLVKQLVPTLEVNPSLDTLRIVEGLTAFITILLKEEPVNLKIYSFQGFQGSTEITNVRFQAGEQAFTFALLASNFDRWMDAILDEDDLDWCQRANSNADLQARNLYLNVNHIKAFVHIPLAMLSEPGLVADPFKDASNEDFVIYGNALERLGKAISEELKAAIKKTDVFVIDKGERDHDLFIVFRAVNDYQNLEIHIEQVWPELPPSGEVNLGSNPLPNWVNDNKASVLAFRQIEVMGKRINREIEKVHAIVKGNPYFEKDFKEFLKINTLAASHFSKRIYSFEKAGNEALVNKVANDVVRKLTHKGGKIGLDLNSWVVWSYEETGIPVKVLDEELDFAKLLPSLYTESFVVALYEFLINLGNPYIKPYDYRTTVEEDDGVAMGSIRVVKQ